MANLLSVGGVLARLLVNVNRKAHTFHFVLSWWRFLRKNEICMAKRSLSVAKKNNKEDGFYTQLSDIGMS